MLRKSCSAKGLHSGGDANALRDRLLKSDLGMGLAASDRPPAPAPAPAPAEGAATAASEPAPAPERYVPVPGEQCYTCGCSQLCDASKECPHCKKRGMRTFFCSNECFKRNWASHKKLHSVDAAHLVKIQSVRRTCSPSPFFPVQQKSQRHRAEAAVRCLSQWGLSRKMAAEILLSTDLGSIAA